MIPKKEGKEWHKIYHIPWIYINDEVIIWAKSPDMTNPLLYSQVLCCTWPAKFQFDSLMFILKLIWDKLTWKMLIW